MQDSQTRRRERVLDPIARVSEVLFGLLMALTFTGTISVATAGQEEVRTLLVGAIGCNIAWGLVDAVMFLLAALVERGHGLVTLRDIRGATSPEQAHAVIGRALSPLAKEILTVEDVERLHQRALQLQSLPPASPLTRPDWLGALAVFLLVMLSTFPIVIPFLVVSNVQLAMRLSNLVAIGLLFWCGYWLAGHAGYRPWLTGLSMVVLGVLLVGITIALGG